MQGAAVVSKYVNYSGREALIEFCGSIPECEAAANVRLNRLVGDDLASPEIDSAGPKAGETGGASGARLSK